MSETYETAKCQIRESNGTWEKPDNWEHRSQNMKCRTCMYFVIKSRTVNTPVDQVSLGRCRRYAPTIKGFPAVFGTDWCGDHKLDENKI